MKLRKHLSHPGLLKTVTRHFQQVPDPSGPDAGIPLRDCLLSGLAVFGLKYPSLLQFDRDRMDEVTAHNLRALYGICQAPCDTYLRERLDEIDPVLLRPVFKQLFAQVQRGNELKRFQFMDDYYLLSVDGTGYFSSHQVHCDQCCVKNHRNGSKTYYHQLLGAVLVHPDHSHVLPFAPEPILKQDGKKKNDCERNAAKRLLRDVRREHPHLKLMVVEDGLASNGPHIKLLKSLDMRFILGAQPKDHTFLFEWVEQANPTEYTFTDDQGHHHQFRYLNGVPLNDSHFDCEINFLDYRETTPSGKTHHFTWVTDVELTETTVYTVMRGGRARWRIENETFNTLKNQGYHFEHNFGHGHRHLSTIMAYLMLLAFLIDQIQGLCCQLFQAAMLEAKSRLRFWRKLRARFEDFLIDDWETLYGSILQHPKIPLRLDSS
ncbi:MAG: transposase [Leucothrix sp.]